MNLYRLHLLQYRRLLCALMLPATLAFAAPTDEDELALLYGDKSSVSLATGSNLSVRRAPAVATVITAQDIAAMGASDLDQVLASVPGLHVNRTPNVYSPMYVVRGVVSAFTPQVLVLQNGVPITTLYTGNKGNLWGGYPLDHIARIEILRGPGSALYGSDAFSGVINIITKGPLDTRGTEAGLALGSFNSRNVWLQHGGTLGPFAVAAYLSGSATDGFRSIVGADAQSRNDTLFGTHASLAPGPVDLNADRVDANFELLAGQWRVRAGYKLRDKLGSGAGVASALDPVGQMRSERVTADLSWTEPQITEDWGAGISLSNLRYIQLTPTDLQLLPPGARFPTGVFPNGMLGGPDTWESQWRLSAFATYAGWRDHVLRVGIGHDDLDLYRTHETRNFNYAANGTPVPLPSVVDFSGSNPFLFPNRRTISYAYVQDEWRLAADWQLTAGWRHDRYNDFGSTSNPRVALVWDAAHDITAKLLAGRAFRAPAFLEAFGVTNPVAQGNRNLRPETTSTIEAVLAWQGVADLNWTANLYRYQMHDIIRTVPNAVVGTGTTYQNTGGQDGRGLEMEVNWSPSRTLRVTANASWQRSIDETNDRDAGYAPRQLYYARADWQFIPGQLISVQANRVADRRRAVGDARAPIADYNTVDLSWSMPGNRNWGFAASVRNLFNADIREPSQAPGLALPNDLPMAPRALWLQVTYKM